MKSLGIDDDFITVFFKGDQYMVECKVETICIQEGNYSPTASDPDEYYGIYKYQLDSIQEVALMEYDEDGDLIDRQYLSPDYLTVEEDQELRDLINEILEERS